MANILVVDDEHGIRDLLSEILNDEGHSVDLAENAAQARQARQQNTYDLVLLDIWMPDTDGVTLLKEWAANGLLTMPVVMMSGHATIETAIEATKIGALSSHEKPITMHKLLKTVELGLAREQSQQAKQTSSLAADTQAAAAATANHTTSAEPVAAAPAATPSAPTSIQSFELDLPLRDVRDTFERAYFAFHLQQENGSMTRVAEKTGLERTHLYRKLKQLGMAFGRERKS